MSFLFYFIFSFMKIQPREGLDNQRDEVSGWVHTKSCLGMGHAGS